MKKSLFLLIIAGVLVFVSCQKEESEGPAPLVVAMELQYPPFEMSDAEGNPAGVSVEIAKALGEYLNRPVVIENTAWTGLIPSLQTGKADVILSSMTITEERAQVVDFSLPYIRAGLALLISQKSDVETFTDLNGSGRVVAVKSGTIGANLANAELPEAEVRVFEDVSACVLEVVQGKADAFIYDPLTVFENNKNHPDTTRVNLTPVPGSEGDWGMAVKQGNQELLEGINSFILDFRKNGGFDRVAAPFLGDIMNLFKENDIPFFFDL